MSSTWLTRRLRRSVSSTTRPRNCWRCCAVHLRVVAHQLGEGADRGQRRAQLVRHRGHEVVLQPVQALELAVQRAHLRGLVEHAQHVVRRQRLLLDHRGHHGTRRGAADRAGELRLDVLHELRVGLDVLDRYDAAAPRVVGEQPLRAPRRRESAPASCCSSASRARPRQNTGAARPRWRAPEHVDEQQRLAASRADGARTSDTATYRPDVGQQAPQQRMGQVVQAGEAEQLLGPQQRDAERPVGEEAACPSSPTWRSTAASASRPTARSRRPGRPARRRGCRPSSTCRRAAPARTAPPRRS